MPWIEVTKAVGVFERKVQVNVDHIAHFESAVSVDGCEITFGGGLSFKVVETCAEVQTKIQNATSWRGPPGA